VPHPPLALPLPAPLVHSVIDKSRFSAEAKFLQSCSRIPCGFLAVPEHFCFGVGGDPTGGPSMARFLDPKSLHRGRFTADAQAQRRDKVLQRALGFLCSSPQRFLFPLGFGSRREPASKCEYFRRFSIGFV
jgi:hypothetical protein